MNIVERIKSIFCEHDYNYWGKEELYLHLEEDKNRFLIPTHTLICRKCNKTIIIRDRTKNDVD